MRPSRRPHCRPFPSQAISFSPLLVPLVVLLSIALQSSTVMITAFAVNSPIRPEVGYATLGRSRRSTTTIRRLRHDDRTNEQKIHHRFMAGTSYTPETKTIHSAVNRTTTGAISDMASTIEHGISIGIVHNGNKDAVINIREDLVDEIQEPTIQLRHEGNHLQLLCGRDNGDDQDEQQQPIVLLDGLSPDIWTAAKPSPPTTKSTDCSEKESSPAPSPSAPNSFSSLVFQTSIPSIPIQSFSLGKFLSSSESSKSDASASSSQQNQNEYSQRWLAAARLNRYWMGPKWSGDNGDSQTAVPIDTQFLLVEIQPRHRPQSTYYALMMPLVDGGYRSSLEATEQEGCDDVKMESRKDHKLTLMSYSESGDVIVATEDSKRMNALYVAVNDDPYELLRLGFQETSNILGTFQTLAQKQISTQFVNSFGWCTWDAFYSKVYPRGVLDGVKCLNDAGIQVKNVILDDGWQQVSPEPNNLHQQQQEDRNHKGKAEKNDANTKKKKSTISSLLSLTGSTDVMPTTGDDDETDCAKNNDSGSIFNIIGLFIKNIFNTMSSIVENNTKSKIMIDDKEESIEFYEATTATAVGTAIPIDEETDIQQVSRTKLSSSSSSSPNISTIKTALIVTPAQILSKLGESLFGLAATTVAYCYQRFVEKAPAGSFPHKLWTFLARHTPLNYGLWEFFDSETDFGRQLDDFQPNWKFENDKGQHQERTELVEGQNKSNMDLKDLITTLKQDWNVNRVYCWHAMHGYWRGVSPKLGKSIGIDVTQLRTRPSDQLLRCEPQMAFDPPSLFGVGLIGQASDLTKFYKHLHEPLVKAGVDGVKVDVQSGVTSAGYHGSMPGGHPLAKLYTRAMEESASKHFPATCTYTTGNVGTASAKPLAVGGVECINCMCHSTENLYRYKKTAVARASDDFYPARPESHSVHLVNVAYNSLFLGEICLPDWDMFQSKHESAELHAAARSIGGCPVYVSDKPGEHNISLLKKLVLPDGSIMRAQQPGRPTRDCIFADVGRDGISALKVWNINQQMVPNAGGPRYNGNNEGGGGVIGAFNVQGVAWNFDTKKNDILDVNASTLSTVTASIRPHDVDSLRHLKGPFAVWLHRSQSLQLLDTGDSTIETDLEQREWEIYTVQSIQRNEYFSVQWAPIGLGSMLNSGGALIEVGPLKETTITTNTVGYENAGTIAKKIITADVMTRGPGRFVSYCQPRPSQVTIHDGTESALHIGFHHDKESGLLEFDLPHEPIEGKAHHVTVTWEEEVELWPFS